MQIDFSPEGATTREQLANVLRKKIISQEYLPGEKLSERVISEMFQVSTMPVKEAFRILVTEGLLETIPRKGTFVSKFAIDRLEQVAYFRSSMEGVAAFFATASITPQELEELRTLLARAWQHLSNGDLEEFTKTNRQFHITLINGCKNPYLINIIKTVRAIDSSIDQELKTSFFKRSYERSVRSYCEHRQIFEAVESRNSILAEQLVMQHVRYSIKYKLRRQSENHKE